MKSQGRQYSNEPVRYDRARVAQLKPIHEAIDKLQLPPLRLRKLRAILGALEVQIEDGGDSPEVNRLLLEALRAAVHHQVDERQAQGVARAVEAFEKTEAVRWERLKAGTLPPIQVSPRERLDELMAIGYDLLKARCRAEACDRWLEGWELVKQLTRPEWKTTSDFDRAYPGHWQSVFNWCQDLHMELGNAGLDNPIYHEHRVRYAREFLDRFPGEDANHYVNFLRAEGEALWELGRQAEAEEVYRSLVERFPREGWGYIGWADQYWQHRDRPKEYERAEEIMKRALAIPDLDDRNDVLERLKGLYAEWGKPAEQAKVAAQRAVVAPRPRTPSLPRFLAKALRVPMGSQEDVGSRAPTEKAEAAPTRRLGRNAPCWCGSGKKYKKCHLRADEEARPR